MPKKPTHLGSIFTPSDVSKVMTNWAIQNANDRILDLGIGEGAFVFAAYNRLLELGADPEVAQKSIFGSEIDEETFLSFKEICKFRQVSFPNIESIDFFHYQAGFDLPFDVVIGNPPYVRRYNIRNVDTIRDIVTESLELEDNDIRNLSDLYVYFILHAAARLKVGGRLCVITADSWLNVGYGKVLRKYLTEFFELEQITIVDYPLFQQAEVKAVVIQAHKKRPQQGACTNFAHVRDENALFATIRANGEAQDRNLYRIEQSKLYSEKPWGIYWKLGDLYTTIVSDPRMAIIESIAKTQIGYQTLAKDFFIFDADDKKLVESKFIQPIINSPSEFARTPIIDAQARISSFVFMCNLDKDNLKNTKALDYILNAENKPVNVRGKNKTVIGYQSKNRIKRSGRKNWYDLKTAIDKRGGSCEILVPRFVFRDYLVLWNQEDYVTGEQFIEFRPKVGFSPKVYLAILNSTLAELMFRAHAQIYGGGTNNMSPGEFKKVPILDPSMISDEQRNRLEFAYDQFVENDLSRFHIDCIIYDILDFDEDIITQIKVNLEEILFSSTGSKSSN